MSAVLQLDLLAMLAEEEAADARAGWRGRFERADWVAPWDCSGGTKKGEVIRGWVCPACGGIEVNEFLLDLNHGYDPSIPLRMAGAIETFGQRCTRQILLASQERARAWKAAQS